MEVYNSLIGFSALICKNINYYIIYNYADMLFLAMFLIHDSDYLLWLLWIFGVMFGCSSFNYLVEYGLPDKKHWKL